MNFLNIDFIKCLPREENILDHCYTTVSSAYHMVPHAALRLSVRVMVHLIPAYWKKVKLYKPVVKTMRLWRIRRHVWTALTGRFLGLLSG